VGKLLAILAIVFSCAAAPAEPDFELDAIADAFRFEGVHTTYEWRDCGMVNAFYDPHRRHVLLCNELRDLEPGAVRYIFAHELSHGVIMQRGVPYTTSHEGAADELAALWLVVIGRADDVYAGARFWRGLGRDENPYDDHFSDLRRAHSLECIARGAQGKSFMCTLEYRRIVKTWIRLLEIK